MAPHSIRFAEVLHKIELYIYQSMIDSDAEGLTLGRPSKFDRDRADRAVMLAGRGWPSTRIAPALGVTRGTLAAWAARGRSGEAPYAAWLMQYEEAADTARVRRAEAAAVRARRHLLEYKRRKQVYWLNKLGAREYWRRRAVWLLEHDRVGPAFVEAILRLRALAGQ
jgi:hypothetical protein